MFKVDPVKRAEHIAVLSDIKRVKSDSSNLLPVDYLDRDIYNARFLDTIGSLIRKEYTGLSISGIYAPPPIGTLEPLVDKVGLLGLGEYYVNKPSGFFRSGKSIVGLVRVLSIDTIITFTLDPCKDTDHYYLATIELMTWSFKNSKWVFHKEVSILKDHIEFKKALAQTLKDSVYVKDSISYKDIRVSNLNKRLRATKEKIIVENYSVRYDPIGLWITDIETNNRVWWFSLPPTTQLKILTA